MRAETPVRIVGSRSGAKRELWGPGTKRPSFAAVASSSGAIAPTRSWTEGTPATRP